MDKPQDQAPHDTAPEDNTPEPQEIVEPRAPVRTPVVELFAGSFD